MSKKSDPEQKTAAGPWTYKGDPDQEGEYLIKYVTHKQNTPFISTGNYLPGTGWLNMWPDMQIVAYAEIYPQIKDESQAEEE